MRSYVTGRVSNYDCYCPVLKKNRNSISDECGALSYK